MNFYLCRHGQTQWNVTKMLQGHLQSNLTDLGIQQAKELADKALRWNIDRVVSSHLSRASDTALAISKHFGSNAMKCQIKNPIQLVRVLLKSASDLWIDLRKSLSGQMHIQTYW